jgi:putative effector of murein hydrolase
MEVTSAGEGTAWGVEVEASEAAILSLGLVFTAITNKMRDGGTSKVFQ